MEEIGEIVREYQKKTYVEKLELLKLERPKERMVELLIEFQQPTKQRRLSAKTLAILVTHFERNWKNIEEFFPIVPVHTMVQIVNQPVKLGWQSKTLYLEVHPQMDEDREQNQNLMCMAYEMIFAEIEGRDAILDIKTIKRALQEKSGMPVPITTFVADGFEF